MTYTSSAIAYKYGVSGPFWYASGATVQIILFATLAIELKRKAPNAHTFLEAIRARYGPVTHGVYIVFGLMTNILVTAMLLTGGSAVATSLCGVPTAAACFLLSVGVVLYTMFGGIKATFLTDYVHTVVILIIILTFAFTAYATGQQLGSPGAVYDALMAATERHPVEGNAGGSYLTMRSKEGAIFFVNSVDEDAKEQAQLQRSAKIARYMTVFMTLALLVLWPMPMYGSGYIFSKKFFTGWVVVGILWLFCSGFCVGLYPLWEGRKTSLRTVKLIFKDVTGQGRPIPTHGRPRMTEDDVSEEQHEKKTSTPPEVEIAH
ncbi:uncharacterized protein MYCFIDRAFT_215251 [Pseudocercospora fijiensis CIRAD86]|uniref:Urea active transporter n=1 Tax=Pseudocercospora fijiensis (strain CIRAD86) TaxID=383855 RepID=M2Z0D2_PSEFD|nr:uncharacterized protein MYCFIDRAFT_215251 [Pseudocercospora fijiensis CIRAD86]EME83280.1 hypothetical protein MYCFIDRAFT_215251 [Pseudocercospora fijiensis CIRAD86]